MYAIPDTGNATRECPIDHLAPLAMSVFAMARIGRFSRHGFSYRCMHVR